LRQKILLKLDFSEAKFLDANLRLHLEACRLNTKLTKVRVVTQSTTFMCSNNPAVWGYCVETEFFQALFTA